MTLSAIFIINPKLKQNSLISITKNEIDLPFIVHLRYHLPKRSGLTVNRRPSKDNPRPEISP